MKTASSTLKNFLAAMQASPDAELVFAECYTFVLANGTTLYYTSADVNILYGGNLFLCSGPIIRGFKYHSTIGLNVDQQELDIYSWPTYNSAGVALSPAPPTVEGAPIMSAIANGVFDLCTVQRDRVFFSDRVGGTLVDGVTLFHGRFLDIEECGRFSAKITVADDLIVLGNQMPRNSYSATCGHALYDVGCTLLAASFATAGTVGGGSTARTLFSTAAAMKHVGGYILFLTGANAGVTANIKNVNAGTNLTLAFPLPEPPAPGDTFTMYQGCDHTGATCAAVFNNIQNFRGFPFVPPPQSAQ